MKEERNIITIDEYGRLNMPTDINTVWMSETEIVELFGVIAPTIRTEIKALCKSGVLREYEAKRLIRLSDKSSSEVYNLETIVALAFRTYSQGAAKLREYILRTLGTVSKQPAISILMTCTRETEGSSIQFLN